MADSKVKHNSPDPTKYHSDSPDIPGTVLPRSDKDGNPIAFDPNKPQAVIVDPYEEGGGFQVDFAQLSKVKGKFNNAAGQRDAGEDPSKFLKTFASNLKEEKPKKEVESAPVAAVEDFQELAPIKPLLNSTEKEVKGKLDEKKEVAQAQMAELEEVRGTYEEIQGYQDKGPDFNELLGYLSKQGAALNALVGTVNDLGNRIHNQKEEPEVEEETVEEPVQESLVDTNISFLTAKPQRPQYETYFEMSKMGTMAARYHAVVAGQDCLALIYDTRFEDGFQYLPPNLGEEQITVSVPRLDNAKFVCSSLGLHWSLGCLDVVILIKHGANES